MQKPSISFSFVEILAALILTIIGVVFLFALFAFISTGIYEQTHIPPTISYTGVVSNANILQIGCGKGGSCLVDNITIISGNTKYGNLLYFGTDGSTDVFVNELHVGDVVRFKAQKLTIKQVTNHSRTVSF